jgi:hypothetical protein
MFIILLMILNDLLWEVLKPRYNIFHLERTQLHLPHAITGPGMDLWEQPLLCVVYLSSGFFQVSIRLEQLSFMSIHCKGKFI